MLLCYAISPLNKQLAELVRGENLVPVVADQALARAELSQVDSEALLDAPDAVEHVVAVHMQLLRRRRGLALVEQVAVQKLHVAYAVARLGGDDVIQDGVVHAKRPQVGVRLAPVEAVVRERIAEVEHSPAVDVVERSHFDIDAGFIRPRDAGLRERETKVAQVLERV